MGAATAQITGHGVVDVLVCRIWMSSKECCRSHDLARLAIAALSDLMFDPGRLYGMKGFGCAKAFDRRDGAFDISQFQRT